MEKERIERERIERERKEKERKELLEKQKKEIEEKKKKELEQKEIKKENLKRNELKNEGKNENKELIGIQAIKEKTKEKAESEGKKENISTQPLEKKSSNKLPTLKRLPTLSQLTDEQYGSKEQVKNNRKLADTKKAKERIDGELRVASNIQTQMLPRQDAIQRDDIDVYGSLLPAREVGGDLFDYFIRDEKLFFCIGDVSGKGVPSAMLMSGTHGCFHAVSTHQHNPARIMQAINETMCERNENNMFVTLFIGVLDLPTGRLCYCNAGHDAPVILSEKGIVKSEKFATALEVKANLPIGIFDNFNYEMQETMLESGSTLFLYTDGLTEAMNKSHKLFGAERMMNLLNTAEDLPPRQLLGKMNMEVYSFMDGMEQSDDLTMMAIRYMPKQFESNFSETLMLKNDVHEVTRFSSFMKSVIEKLDIEKSLGRQLRLAVEEAVVNVINYAYPDDTDGDITVKMASDGKTLHCQIIDAGIPFDPTTQEKADITLSAQDRQVGGLGILLVRELMDSINYERIDGQNVLTLIKKVKEYKGKKVKK